MENLLITKADIQLYIEDIPATLDEKRLATYIREAQRRILKPLLTTELYAGFLAAVGAVTPEAPLLAPWPNLQDAIKPILVHHAWADYVLFSQGTATAYSYVRKTDQRSEPLEAQTLAMVHKRLKAIGDGYASDLIDYLRENRELYPLYENNYCKTVTGYAGGDTMQRI